jgi:hypothetical protein
VIISKLIKEIRAIFDGYLNPSITIFRILHTVLLSKFVQTLTPLLPVSEEDPEYQIEKPTLIAAYKRIDKLATTIIQKCYLDNEDLEIE